MTERMNMAKASEIFNREAILVGENDVVPFSKVVELFGKEAAEFAKKQNKGWNIYGTGKKQLEYLKFSGFCLAVTYTNINSPKGGASQ